jgi:hypothetical protein
MNNAEMQVARVVAAWGETPLFFLGDKVRVLVRSPIGHYRVPIYLRGKVGTIKAIIVPTAVDNEQEGYGRNAGERRHYYRVEIPLKDIWMNYPASSRDSLWIEIFETWLERI